MNDLSLAINAGTKDYISFTLLMEVIIKEYSQTLM
jgi:hypothetical protein